MNSVKAIVAATLASAAFLGCGRDPVHPVEQNSDLQLTASPDTVVVGVAETSPLSVTVRNASGAIQHVPLSYASRDLNVATVNANGAIRGVAAGSTYVVAALADRAAVRDSVRVRVHADSCPGARPDFGGPATEEERKLFAYDINAPLNLQKTFKSTGNGVETSTITFSSPAGGVVTGLMWEPINRAGLRPGMVLLHGQPGTANDMTIFAQAYARSGAVVVAIDAPWNRRGGMVLSFTPEDRDEQIQVIKDLQRAIDILRSHPNVDDDRIAFTGGSWGASMGALFVGIERRLKTAALIVGHPGPVSLATHGEGFARLFPCAQRVAWIGAMAPIEPIRFIGHANVPLLLQNGTSDWNIPSSLAAALHAAAPEPRTIRWYPTGHNLNQQASWDLHDWLVQQIGLDPRAGT